MKFGIKNGFEIMKKGVDMDHEGNGQYSKRFYGTDWHIRF